VELAEPASGSKVLPHDRELQSRRCRPAGRYGSVTAGAARFPTALRRRRSSITSSRGRAAWPGRVLKIGSTICVRYAQTHDAQIKERRDG
jgi:hypothetical protein